jgi:hypothetical protein
MRATFGPTRRRRPKLGWMATFTPLLSARPRRSPPGLRRNRPGRARGRGATGRTSPAHGAPRRHRKTHDLLHALARYPEMTRCRALTHPLPTGEANLPVPFHGENTPALPAPRKGQSGRVLLRRSGTIPPPPWLTFPPPFPLDCGSLDTHRNFASVASLAPAATPHSVFRWRSGSRVPPKSPVVRHAQASVVSLRRHAPASAASRASALGACCGPLSRHAGVTTRKCSECTT